MQGQTPRTECKIVGATLVSQDHVRIKIVLEKHILSATTPTFDEISGPGSWGGGRGVVNTYSQKYEQSKQ